jgi:uncharacterized protein (DUF362 family)
MDRRGFLRITAAAGAGLALPGGLAMAAKKGAGTSTLAVAKGKDPAAITRGAVEALGGMGRFVGRGEVVVVKPNIGWDRRPEQAANTNPEVVAEVVRMCMEAGARTIKVLDRTCNDPRRCYVQSGIAEALKPLDAELRHIDERRFRKVKIGGRAIKDWPLYSEVLDADRLINVPIAKHHGLARLTMAIKNWMGVMGGRRSAIHQKLDQALADLMLVIKPDLTILDAVRILTDNGPQGGSLKDVRKLDTVIAGTDQVAVDSYGATLFGLTGSDLGYVTAAEDMGLGTSDLSAIRIMEITL